MIGTPAPAAGQLRDPYFLGDAPLAQARPFSHQAHDIFLVTRLDGSTESDVLGLIDRGAAPSRGGRIILDGKAAWDEFGNEWLQAVADRLTAAGLKQGSSGFRRHEPCHDGRGGRARLLLVGLERPGY